MAHVWNVIDGDIYVSKNGDDVTGDGTMANPYASINKATTVGVAGNKIVIGTGVWKEARGNSTNSYHFIGDGDVFFDYAGASYFTPRINYSSGSDTLESIQLINNDGINIYYQSGLDLAFTQQTLCYFIKCKIDWIGRLSSSTHLTAGASFQNCLIKKIDFANYSAYRHNWHISFQNCTILNFLHYGEPYKTIRYYMFVNNLIYSYVENTVADSVIVNRAVTNNFVTNGEYITDLLITDSTNVKSLSPKFNNPEIGDYTLQPNSPCLFAGKNNATIGAFGLGYSFDANSSEFTKEGGAVFSQTTLVDDIIRTSQVINGVTRFLFQLASGHASGNVESAWIDLQSIRYLLITRLFANIIYNASGVATSRPDNLETAGEKAVFYDFELKYCNEESEKATAAWKNVIWNKAVTIDNTGRGNADPAFVASEAQYISARFIKIKLYMTEA